MIIARLHRGSLTESLATQTTFDNINDMKKWFVNQYNNAFSVDDVIIEEESFYDNRTKWNTNYVCTKKINDKDYIQKYGSPQCIGMCDLEYVTENGL